MTRRLSAPDDLLQVVVEGGEEDIEDGVGVGGGGAMSLEANMKAETDNGHKSRSFRNKVFAIVVILLLNVLTLYAFTSLTNVHKYNQMLRQASVRESRLHSSMITSELALSTQLNNTQDELQQVRRELRQAVEQYRKLFEELEIVSRNLQQENHRNNNNEGEREQGDDMKSRQVARDLVERLASFEEDPYNGWMLQMRQTLPVELREYVTPRKLPLGWNPSLSTDSMMSSVGHACVAAREDIESFMSYEVGKLCPDDDNLAQKLLLEGCEPLPRRRYLFTRPTDAICLSLISPCNCFLYYFLNIIMVMVVPLLLSPSSESMSCFLEALLQPSMDLWLLLCMLRHSFLGIKISFDLSRSLEIIIFSSIHPPSL